MVKDNKYTLLFDNYIDSRLGWQMTWFPQEEMVKKLDEYYDSKKSFRKGKQLRVLELARIFYAGVNIYDSSKYDFEYELVDINMGDKILQKINDFKPDVIIAQDSTASARKIYNHKNILYINNNDYSPYIYLAKEKNYPANEIVLFFQKDKIIHEIFSDNASSNHIVQWDYVEDANFLDSEIKVSDIFQTDILIAGTHNSSILKTKQYIKSHCMPLWMLGSEFVKNDFLRALYMMMDELYQMMDATGILIDDKEEYVKIFDQIVCENNLKLDFIKELSEEDIEYFYKYLWTTVVEPVFRFLIVKWIIDRKYSLSLWGDSWKEEEITGKFYKGTIENREELKQTYNKAKICLFTNPDLSIHFSVFEIIGSKSLCLAYENEKVSCSSPFSKYFEDGKSIVLFHDREELYKKIDYYLSNLDQRKQIIEQGNKIMMHNNVCWENELSKAVHQAVKQAEENGMFI